MLELKWMKRSSLTLMIGLILSTTVMAEESTQPADEAQDAVVADEQSAYQEPDPSVVDAHDPNAPAVEEASQPIQTTAPTSENTASDALQQQEGDATQQANLEEVFTATDRQYSLLKRGSFSANYDIDYSYYRDTQLDLALDDSSSSLTRLRIEDAASHNITNTFSGQYGLLDNVTLSASVPLVAKSDSLKDASTAGLGDIGLGMRWEPFPLKQGRLPLILFGNVSLKTGDSPYEINAVRDLPTGSGYYSVGGGASTRKYVDPVVLFASVSGSYGFDVSNINQVRGSRVLDSFKPGYSGGFAFGFAYSFNYDVSMTMSYSQSFSTGTEFRFTNGDVSRPADSSSASLGISLGVRVSPQTIVNGSVGIGLTEDAPDVSLGLSFPLDFLSFTPKGL